MRNPKVSALARWALLAALALVLGFFERLLPLQTGIPGVKLGLGNLSVLLTLFLMGPLAALSVMLVKVLVGGFLYGTMASIVYALGGGLLSWLGMVAARRWLHMGELGTSVAGAVLHNTGQWLVALWWLQTMGLVSYLPLLIVAGVIAGAVTGLLARALLPRIQAALRKPERRRGG